MKAIAVKDRLLECKIHHSPNLTKFFNKHGNANLRFLHVSSLSLRKMREQTIKECELFIGYNYPGQEGTQPVRVQFIRGVRVGQVLCSPNAVLSYDALESKHWAIDVTDKVIAEYLKKGMCTFHDSRHEFETLSKRVRRCTICGQVQKSRTETFKKIRWENKKL